MLLTFKIEKNTIKIKYIMGRRTNRRVANKITGYTDFEKLASYLIFFWKVLI